MAGVTEQTWEITMSARKGEAGAIGSDTKGPQPDGSRRRTTEDDDVEGHNMGQNAMLSRGTAQAREHDIQRKLKQHELETQARRPHQKDGR
jgi:hypothetical protein